MGFAAITRRLTRRRAQLTVFGSLVAICLLAVTFLGTQVFMKLDDYASASQDNVPWSISQLEVDQLKLINALRALDAQDPETLNVLNRRFDAFYSRAGTLTVGRARDPIKDDPDASASLQRLQGQLFAMEGIMDSTDGAIFAEQANLTRMAQAMSDPIRRIAAFALTSDARLKEFERGALTAKLVQVTALSLLLLIAMGCLGVLLWQLYRLYRHRARENRQTLNRLATILDTSQDGVLVVCPDGCIIDTNRAANDMFFAGSKPPEHASVANVLKRKAKDGSLSPISGEALLASCAEGPNLSSDLIAETHSGLQFPVELSADTAMRSGQKVVICFLRNISRRLADQAALLAARDKAISGEQAKARFLGAISHEMRTPLTGMLGALDLLDDTAISPKQRTYTQIMQSSGQILLNQINDALDLAQADQSRNSVAHEAFDLNEMLDMLIRSQRPMAHKAGNTLTLTAAASSLGVVHGDRGRVYQVLINLISNAIKFTNAGEITLDVSRLPNAKGAPGETIEFQIIDSGIGIHDDDQARIFEDFVRLDAARDAQIEGTGLGLGIVRNLVVMMDGEIGVESELGEGSVFWVRLPLPLAAEMPVAIPPAQTTPKPQPHDILVVEDNDINRAVLTELLESDGHRVWPASDGADAVDQAHARAFDVILMDINMPVMDGLAATRSIRAGQGASKDSQIIALSAHVSPQTQADVLDAGMNAALTKPLSRDALNQLLATGAQDLRPQTALEVLNASVLDQLTSALDPQSMTQLLVGFRAQGQMLMQDLPTLKGEELPARLHDFAGLSATLGAQALHSALSKAELALRAGDAQGSDEALGTLPALWDETCEALPKAKSAA